MAKNRNHNNNHPLSPSEKKLARIPSVNDEMDEEEQRPLLAASKAAESLGEENGTETPNYEDHGDLESTISKLRELLANKNKSGDSTESKDSRTREENGNLISNDSVFEPAEIAPTSPLRKPIFRPTR